MRYRKGTFITVPNKEVLAGLDPQTQVLYMWLNHYSNEDGECFPSIETLSKCCGMSDRTVHRRLSDLTDLGLISKQNQFVDSRQTTNLYTINLVEGVSESHPRGCQRVTPGGDTVADRTQSIGTQSIYIPETKVSEETKNNKEEVTLTSVTKDSLGGNTESITPQKFDVVPTDDFGNPISQRKPKPKEAWQVERRIFNHFSEQCQNAIGQKPMAPPIWQLKHIRGCLESFTEDQLCDVIDEWVDTAADDKVLNIHYALSVQNLNSYKTRS